MDFNEFYANIHKYSLLNCRNEPFFLTSAPLLADRRTPMLANFYLGPPIPLPTGPPCLPFAGVTARPPLARCRQSSVRTRVLRGGIARDELMKDGGRKERRKEGREYRVSGSASWVGSGTKYFTTR